MIVVDGIFMGNPNEIVEFAASIFLDVNHLLLIENSSFKFVLFIIHYFLFFSIKSMTKRVRSFSYD
jgi:hypothetical protein